MTMVLLENLGLDPKKTNPLSRRTTLILRILRMTLRILRKMTNPNWQKCLMKVRRKNHAREMNLKKSVLILKIST